jgi:outer membrane receptor protein involved in Fe transport/dihydrodipicolinate synthase/N-acetylneuraminate lyase
MTTTRTRSVSGVRLGAAIAAVIATSLGPTSPAAAAERATSALEEIVVTAQKRTQDLQDVPVAVTAIQADQLDARGVRDFDNYLRTVPGVAFAELGNQSNEVKIRGVGTGTAQLSPTTAIYLGEVPVIHTGRGLNSSYNFRLVDIERIEVLRGPQGQLYGSNSLGGAIKNIPTRAKLDSFALSGSASGSGMTEGDDSYDADLTINVPLGTSAGVRLTAYYASLGGWYDNVYAGGRPLNSLLPVPPLFQGTVNGQPVGTPFGPPWAALAPAVPILRFPLPAGPPGPPLRVVPGILARNPAAATYVAPSNAEENVNDSTVRGARLMSTFVASDTFRADVMVAYERKKNEGTSWTTAVPAVPGPIAGTYVVPRTVPNSTPVPVLYPSNFRDYEQVNPVDAGNEDEILLANLLLEWDLGFGTLTSSTSYWDRTETLQTDLGILAFPTTGVSGTFPVVVNRDDMPKSYIQELRLTSDDDGRLSWLAGLFWQRIPQDYRVEVTDLSGLDILRTDRTVRAAINNTAPPPAGPVGLQIGKFEDTQYAVFGEIAYDVTPKFNAAFSFRWFDLEQESELINTGFFFATQGNSLRKNDASEFTPKLNLSYRPSGDLLFYATAAEGYRTGITNRTLPLDLCARELANAGYPDGVPPTEADTLWNYELGAKMTFADRRVSVNAAIYRIDWSDLQAQVFLSALKDPAVAVSQCTFETIFNVGDAQIDGAELEVAAKLGERPAARRSAGVDRCALQGHVRADRHRRRPADRGRAGLHRVPRAAVRLRAVRPQRLCARRLDIHRRDRAAWYGLQGAGAADRDRRVPPAQRARRREPHGERPARAVGGQPDQRVRRHARDRPGRRRTADAVHDPAAQCGRDAPHQLLNGSPPMNRREFSQIVGLGAAGLVGAAAAPAFAAAPAPGDRPAARPVAKGAGANRVARADRKAWAREHFKGFENILLPSFTPDGKNLDEAGIRLDVRKSIEHGFFSTLAPAIALSPAEYRRFLEIVVDEAKDRISVAVAGEGGETGPMGKQLLKDCEAIGCSHMILSLPPTGSAQDLIRYGTETSEATNMGIYLWMAQIHDFKRFHSSRIPFEVFDSLANLPNVVALKVGDPDPATIFQLFERYNERMLIGALMPNVMPLAVKAYGQQWSGAFTVEAMQTPGKRYAVDYFDLLRAGKYEDAMKLYWQYVAPLFGAMMKMMGPLMPAGGHPWEHLKVYQFLGGMNGGRMRPDPHQPDLPKLRPEDLEGPRGLFAKLGLDPVDLPFEAMQVGRVNYEKGVRAKDLA